MRGIYSFDWDYGRGGSIQGTFIATPEQIKDFVGKTLYFGECLGKHSNVYFTIEAVEDFDLLTEDQEFIEKAIAFNLVPTGKNPFLALREDEDEDEEE